MLGYDGEGGGGGASWRTGSEKQSVPPVAEGKEKKNWDEVS